MSDDGYFGEAVAARYDDGGPMFAPALVAQTVAFLKAQARGGKALEFAIGTGRIALPLARQGVPVAGIDLSPEMVARLRAKPGGEAIDVTIGDMTTVRHAGDFTLVYLLFNTIGNLTSQQAQAACFANAARHLLPGGCFVVEMMMPPLQRLPVGERFLPFDVSETHWGVDEIDVATQGLISHHVHFRGGEAFRHSVPMRYVWPSELDLMAQLAGLRLSGRWADWAGGAFVAGAASHVSVWSKPVQG